jgi:hypothetical protein
MDELTLFKFNVDGISFGRSSGVEEQPLASEDLESEAPRRSRSMGRRIGQALAVSIGMSILATLIARRVASRFGGDEMDSLGDEESPIDEDSEVVSVDA